MDAVLAKGEDYCTNILMVYFIEQNHGIFKEVSEPLEEI